VTALYLAVLATPLTSLIDLPFNKAYLESKKALFIAAILFAFLHGYFGFFQELGGFSGLGFLNNTYLVAIALSFTALCVVIFITWRWQKWLIERLIYISVLLITFHALLLGTHFTNLSGQIPQLFFLCLSSLLVLESIRLDKFLITKLELPRTSIAFALVLLLIALGALYLFNPQSSTVNSPLNVHAAHIAIAKQAQAGNLNPGINFNNPAIANNPGLIGDRTLRYTASFNHPDNVQPNQDTQLSFQVFNASSGTEQDLFSFVYSKIMHLIIVDDTLTYFNHIHPTQEGSTFSITTQFPHPGIYHLYIDFQPLGAIEQQLAFTLQVGDNLTPQKATQKPDTNLTKTFGNYKVSLSYPSPLQASQLSIGGQQMSFKIYNAQTGQPVTTLKPYLAAYGHLVLINESTYDYIHVHPTNIVPPAPDANGGPEVDFLPLGLYGPIKPGIYRVFAQFNPDNNLFTSDFTVEVK